jgi:N-acetylneuraminic acid mutarotase
MKKFSIISGSRLPLAVLVCSGFVMLALPASMATPSTFSSAGVMNTARTHQTATLLSNGKVLVAGGYNGGSLASAELYDPASGNWSVTGDLVAGRDDHTATLLPNGKVLVVGGYNIGSLASAELYDPATGTWNATGSLATARYSHTATLLPNGKVLVVGGYNAGSLASAELYDPASGTWSATGSLATARYSHTATLLQGGTVLVAGGKGASTLASAELYNPASGTWSTTGSLAAARYAQSATLLPSGKVLIAGGTDTNLNELASAELYDPASGSWGATGSMIRARSDHTATLLPDGKVLVAGGYNGAFLAAAEIYDPESGVNWSATFGGMGTVREDHTATILPNGTVLVTGGYNGNPLASAERYDPANGSWSTTGSLAAARYAQSATLLPSGKVLIAGGDNDNELASAELYDPASGTWSATGSLATARYSHTATLLPNEKVLVAGGYNNTSGFLASAELYDPASGTWNATGSLATGRYRHTATLLANGKVLVAGGYGSSGNLSSAELYDPATGTWSTTGSLGYPRFAATATLLPSGKVLVAGGENLSGGVVSADHSAELYDPGSGNWSQEHSLSAGRYDHTATLLPDGKLLVAGGYGNNGGFLATAELYDPASGFWSSTGAMNNPHANHAAALLPNGKVLVVGGLDSGGSAVASAELYDPATGGGIWISTGSMSTARGNFMAKLLPNGSVLVAGGFNAVDTLASAEVYNVGLGFLPAWQPQISTATSPLRPVANLSLTGLRFQGVSSASGGGGTTDSSTNYPIVQLSSLDSNQTVTLPVGPSAGWSDTAFQSSPVIGFPFGPALVTVFTNGIQSNSTMIVVGDPPGITYSSNSFTYVEGQPISTIMPANNGGTAVSFTISPALPDGLSFDPVTGTISGTPTAVSSTTTYTVTATNDSGTSTFTFTLTITTAVVPPAKSQNIATRVEVQGNDNVLIGGFIITGTAPKKVILRAIGPSLPLGAAALADPVLALHFPDGSVVTNDNWKIDDQSGQSQQAIIEATTIPPASDLESALVQTLVPGNYTAIVSGNNGGTGVGLIEVYDLDAAAASTLANISTRGFVDTGDNVMIGGFIVGPPSASSTKVIIRGIGPSLPLGNVLADPVLVLHDGNGATLATNDNWQDDSGAAEIQADQLAPGNPLESALLRVLPPGAYTVILSGNGDATGVGLIEVYNVGQ